MTTFGPFPSFLCWGNGISSPSHFHFRCKYKMFNMDTTCSPPPFTLYRGVGNGIKMQFNQIADADVVLVVIVAIVLNLNNFLSLSLILFGCFFFLDNFCVKCSLLFSLDFLLSCIVVLRFFMEPVRPSVFSFFLRRETKAVV